MQQMFLIIYVYVCMYICIHVYIYYIYINIDHLLVCVHIILYIYTTEDYLGHSRYSVNFLTNRKLVKDVCVFIENRQLDTSYGNSFD